MRGHASGLAHARFAPLRRIAVGVTIIDPADPAYTGFDLVLARARLITALRRAAAGP